MKIFAGFFVLSAVMLAALVMPTSGQSETSKYEGDMAGMDGMDGMDGMAGMAEVSPMPAMAASSPAPADAEDRPDTMSDGDTEAAPDAKDKPDMSAASGSPFRMCRGGATYALTFINLLTPARFGSMIPAAGLVYSPLIAVSHSNRVSLMTVRGYASPQIEEIAETGNNEPLANLSRSLVPKGYVLNVTTADGPTMPGYATTLKVKVDCERPFITMLGMIAPSPDWIVQVSNRNLFSERLGQFSEGSEGSLIAYDAGVDSGREFTDPADASLDKPTEPAKNIAPLNEDETDRFGGRVVGWYKFVRVM